MSSHVVGVFARAAGSIEGCLGLESSARVGGVARKHGPVLFINGSSALRRIGDGARSSLRLREDWFGEGVGVLALRNIGTDARLVGLVSGINGGQALALRFFNGDGSTSGSDALEESSPRHQVGHAGTVSLLVEEILDGNGDTARARANDVAKGVF